MSLQPIDPRKPPKLPRALGQAGRLRIDWGAMVGHPINTIHGAIFLELVRYQRYSTGARVPVVRIQRPNGVVQKIHWTNVRLTLPHRTTGRAYDLTESEFTWLYNQYSEPGGGLVCALTRQTRNNAKKNLHIDHAHNDPGCRHKKSQLGCKKCIRGILKGVWNRTTMPVLEKNPLLQSQTVRRYLRGRTFAGTAIKINREGSVVLIPKFER